MMALQGRPTRARAQELDRVSDMIADAYFGTDETTRDIAARFEVSLRSLYRRVQRSQRNKRRAARASALARMDAA